MLYRGDNMKQGYTGISFPFRIGVKGGVVMSSTSVTDVSHIIEAMKQIILTRPMERFMNYNFKCDVDTEIFDPNDLSTQTLISYQVKDALKKLEDRIIVTDVKVTSEDSTIYAEITFKVLSYNTTFSATLKVGDISVQSANAGN